MPATHQTATARTAILALVVSTLSAVARGDEFPYEAYVAVEQADVVAGPGHRFYVTDRLTFGTKVEIYREEPSGWLAIRPPDGTFSWVPGEFVERLEDDNLGRVSAPTPVWVGTSIEHVTQHQKQVTLKSGELVQILGEKTVAAAEGSERKWFKIAPPAGEYRWVYLRDVSRQLPEERPASRLAEVPAEEPMEEPLAEEPHRFTLAGNPIALRNIESAATRRDGNIALAQFRSTATSPGSVGSPDGFVPRKRREGSAEAAVAPLPAKVGTTPSLAPRGIATRPAPSAMAADYPATRLAQAPITAEPSGGGVAPAEVNRQLEQIEIELSLALAQNPAQWQLAPIKQRVETLVANGADPAARGRARLLLDKIKQFETTFNAPAAPPSVRTSVTASNPALDDPRYDAQGVLKEVVSRKSARPAAPYAVVDAEGKPVCFVSPSPGLNLNRFLNKPVGLYGRRGYLEELKKPHVVAENVIELDTRLR